MSPLTRFDECCIVILHQLYYELQILFTTINKSSLGLLVLIIIVLSSVIPIIHHLMRSFQIYALNLENHQSTLNHPPNTHTHLNKIFFKRKEENTCKKNR